MKNLILPAVLMAIAQITQSCAIEPARKASASNNSLRDVIVAPAALNQAVIVARSGNGNRDANAPDGPWVRFDVQGMKSALENCAERFQVRVVAPESGAMVSETIQRAATRTARDGTLLVLFAGYANERGEIAMDDGSAFTWASMILAVRPTPGFKRLITVVSASLEAKWMDETAAMDPARTFPESIIATSVPRMFAPEGEDSIDRDGAIDEMNEGLLHPAATRMLTTFRAALDPGSSTRQRPGALAGEQGILAALWRMKENHELLYGPGPVFSSTR